MQGQRGRVCDTYSPCHPVTLSRTRLLYFLEKFHIPGHSRRPASILLQCGDGSAGGCAVSFLFAVSRRRFNLSGVLVPVKTIMPRPVKTGRTSQNKIAVPTVTT